MIVKLHRGGRSFKGVARYLAHDPKAETTQRVAWTYTLNLASDHVALAVDEMLWTARASDLLKREAGVGTGGSKLDKPVKHFSLSWAQGETPTQEHMIETVRAYLEHMGWSDRQAILFAHNDTRHPHVHVVMNSVSPHDGRGVRSSHDWRRSEAFALQYERAQGRIHCEERLKPQAERDGSPTRDTWQRYKASEHAFERSELDRRMRPLNHFERHDAKRMVDHEWEALKSYQKEQREQFFVEGKQAFRAVRKEVFREVRNEFRAQWNAYYAARRSGQASSSLAEIKASLLQAQREALDERRLQATEQLREKREQRYEAILEQQRFDRAELGRRQQQGLRTYQVFDLICPGAENDGVNRQPDSPAVWQNHAGETPAASAKARLFERAGQDAIHPHAEAGRGLPGIVTRDAPPIVGDAPSGGGRQDGHRVLSQERVSETVIRGAAPAPGREMSDRTSERIGARKAQEISDQEAAKEGQAYEAGHPRASWSRSGRSRGGRD